jgi:hypothetical protein
MLVGRHRKKLFRGTKENCFRQSKNFATLDSPTVHAGVIEKFEVKANILIGEIASCRETMRAAQNHQVQMMLAGAAALTMLFTVYGYIGKSAIIRPVIPFVTLFLVLALLTYIAAQGISVPLRYQYIKHLEKELRSLVEYNLYYWEEIDTQIATLTLENMSKKAAPFFTLMMVSMGSLLIACIAFASPMILDIVPPEWHLFFILCIFVLAIIILVPFLIITQGSKEYYSYALRKLRKRDIKDNVDAVDPKEEHEHMHSSIKESKLKSRAKIYFIFPRPQDAQKALFSLFGVAVGIMMVVLVGGGKGQDGINWAWAFFGGVFVVFALEFLLYQARYQLNDIRGFVEDREHPHSEARCRLDFVAKHLFNKNEKHAIIMSFLVGVLKILICFIILFFLCSGWLSFVVPGLILLVAVAYEYVRAKNWGKGTMALVAVGYVIRFLGGVYLGCLVLSFNPVAIIVGRDEVFAILIVVALAIGVRNAMTIYVGWTLEALDKRSKGKAVNSLSAHFQFLVKYYDRKARAVSGETKSDAPMNLPIAGLTIWNACLVVALVLFSFPIMSISSWDLMVALVEIISCAAIASIAIWFPKQFRGFREWFIVVPVVLFIFEIIICFFALWQQVSFWPSYVLAFMFSGEKLICSWMGYFQLMNSNYEKMLYGFQNFIDTIINKITNIIVPRLLALAFGRKTFETYFDRSIPDKNHQN